MQKKHIVIVANNMDGGVGTFLNQMSTLQTNKRTIALLTLRKEINAAIPSFSSINSFSGNPYLPLQIFQEFLWLKKHIHLQKPDSIISVDVHASLLVCFLKILFFPNITLIISNRNNVRHVMKEKFSFPARTCLWIFCRYLLPQANTIICVSKGLAKDFKNYFYLKKNITSIYNSINLSQARASGKQAIQRQDTYLFSSEKKTIVTIGRLEKQKDFETLIRAMQIIIKRIPNAQLLIIGDGSQKTIIQTLIQQLQLERSVFLIGWKKNVYPYLKKADLFVLSSHYEGFGYVLIEAMSQGTPIISTDSPFGPAEVLAKGIYGMLTPVGNVQIMAAHMLKLLQDKKVAHFYARQSEARASYFSEQRMLSQYQKFL